MARLALIFDVDGTLADTETAHREAFNEAFVAEGLEWSWDEVLYTRLLAVAGGKERLAAYWSEVELGPTPRVLLGSVHRTKTQIYAAKVEAGRVPLRPGVLRLIGEASAARLPLAIATTTTASNVEVLLRVALGTGWRNTFAAIADASTTLLKKPDPQVYLHVLATLDRELRACVAFEDSYNGLAAARGAGIPTVITPTAFTKNDDLTGALRVLPDLSSLGLDELMTMTEQSRKESDSCLALRSR